MPITVLIKPDACAPPPLREERILPWEPGMTAIDIIPSDYSKALVIRDGFPLSSDTELEDGDIVNVVGVPAGPLTALFVVVGFIAAQMTIRHYQKKFANMLDDGGKFLQKDSDIYGWEGINTRKGQGFGMPIIFGHIKTGGILGGAMMQSTGPRSVGLNMLVWLGEGPLRKIGDKTVSDYSAQGIDSLLINELPLGTYAAVANYSMGLDEPVDPDDRAFMPKWFNRYFTTTEQVNGALELKGTAVEGLYFRDFHKDGGYLAPCPDMVNLSVSGSQGGLGGVRNVDLDTTGAGTRTKLTSLPEGPHTWGISHIIDDKDEANRPSWYPATSDPVGTFTGNHDANTSAAVEGRSQTRWLVADANQFVPGDKIVLNNHKVGYWDTDDSGWGPPPPPGGHNYKEMLRTQWVDKACYSNTVDFFTSTSGVGTKTSRGRYGPCEYELL